MSISYWYNVGKTIDGYKSLEFIYEETIMKAEKRVYIIVVLLLLTALSLVIGIRLARRHFTVEEEQEITKEEAVRIAYEKIDQIYREDDHFLKSFSGGDPGLTYTIEVADPEFIKGKWEMDVWVVSERDGMTDRIYNHVTITKQDVVVMTGA